MRERETERDVTDLSPLSPLAPKSLWESRIMILSSLDLWTRMLWTADVSAATTANPLPTNPNTHSIFLCWNDLNEARLFASCPWMRLRDEIAEDENTQNKVDIFFLSLLGSWMRLFAFFSDAFTRKDCRRENECAKYRCAWATRKAEDY